MSLADLLDDSTTMTWMADARCMDADAEAFFPQKGQPVDAAVAICQSCPVRTDCLEYALDNNEKFGVWGGMSERQRRRLANKRTAA